MMGGKIFPKGNHMPDSLSSAFGKRSPLCVSAVSTPLGLAEYPAHLYASTPTCKRFLDTNFQSNLKDKFLLSCWYACPPPATLLTEPYPFLTRLLTPQNYDLAKPNGVFRLKEPTSPIPPQQTPVEFIRQRINDHL